MPSSVIRRFVYDQIRRTVGRVRDRPPLRLFGRAAGSRRARFGSAFSKGIYFNTPHPRPLPHREIVARGRRQPNLKARRAHNRAHDPDAHSSIFKSRWMALLWAAGIIWFAYDFAAPTATSELRPDNEMQITDASGAPVTPDEAKQLEEALNSL